MNQKLLITLTLGVVLVMSGCANSPAPIEPVEQPAEPTEPEAVETIWPQVGPDVGMLAPADTVSPDAPILIQRLLDLDGDGIQERVTVRQQESELQTWVSTYLEEISGTDIYVTLEQKQANEWTALVENLLISHTPNYPKSAGFIDFLTGDITGDGNPDIVISLPDTSEQYTTTTFLGFTPERQGLLDFWIGHRYAISIEDGQVTTRPGEFWPEEIKTPEWLAPIPHIWNGEEFVSAFVADKTKDTN